MWAQCGGSACAESEEGEQKRVRALEEALEFCLLSPQLSLASPSLPRALTGPCENAFSQAAGENLCVPGRASGIWFSGAMLTSPLS